MNNSDLLAQMANDADSQATATPDKLEELALLVQELRDMEAEVEQAEKALKAKKEALANIGEIRIPDLFEQLGLDSLKLKTGEKVEINRSYAASITQEKQEAAFRWLKENGHESLIKHDLAVALKKGEEQEHAKLLKELADLGLTYTDKSYVHPMTLKSFVKEQMTAGTDFPQETFSVFPVRKTKIS